MGSSDSKESGGQQQQSQPTPPSSSSTSRQQGGRGSGRSGGAAEQEKTPQQMGYWEQAKVGYQELCNAIIRPPRADYDEAHLGPREFTFAQHEFRRTDLELRNERGMKIVCSHWEPKVRRAESLPCVIYMHGNSSARVEAIPQLALVLSLGATMFSFDFTGSGLSDGEYVSLGHFEREDLKSVVEHLRESGRVSTIALWGRSMGAATSLMHGDRDPSIAAMILDSPFADLTQLAEEMVDKGRSQGLMVPGFVVSIAISMIRGSVKKQAGFNIKDISPIKNVDKCFIPALFVAGESDDFILPHHSEAIHAKYAGDKNMVRVEGDHNSARPRFLFDSATIFLQNYLQIRPDWAISGADVYNNGYAPWHSGFPGYMGSSLALDEVQMRMAGLETTFDELNLGMTQERQRETQNALFNMLSGGTYQDQPPLSQQSSNVPLEDGPEWACEICTFINSGNARTCSACGGMRPLP